MSRKKELLEAASTVILAHGISQFTIEAVAIEANVSKGGLLYHFPTKEELIKAMNVQVINQFKALIEKEVSAGHFYHEAYLLATLSSLKDPNFLNINTSLLAAVTNDKDVLALWRQAFQDIYQKFSEENYQSVHTSLVQATCDGLWYLKLFQITELDIKKEEQLIYYLLKLLRED